MSHLKQSGVHPEADSEGRLGSVPGERARLQGGAGCEAGSPL